MSSMTKKRLHGTVLYDAGIVDLIVKEKIAPLLAEDTDLVVEDFIKMLTSEHNVLSQHQFASRTTIEKLDLFHQFNMLSRMPPVEVFYEHLDKLFAFFKPETRIKLEYIAKTIREFRPARRNDIRVEPELPFGLKYSMEQKDSVWRKHFFVHSLCITCKKEWRLTVEIKNAALWCCQCEIRKLYSRVVGISLALYPLQLPAYVMLWLINWVPALEKQNWPIKQTFYRWTDLDKLRIIEGTYRSCEQVKKPKRAVVHCSSSSIET